MSNVEIELQNEAIQLEKEIATIRKEIKDYVNTIDSSGRKILTMDELMELNKMYDRLTPKLNRYEYTKEFL